MERLAAHLDDPQVRAALRHEWFLDAALPQSLAAAAVMVKTPSPTFAARVRAWSARQSAGEPRDVGAALLMLRWWARGAFAAVVLGAVAAWMVWPLPTQISPSVSANADTTDADADADPALIAGLLLEQQLTDSP